MQEKIMQEKVILEDVLAEFYPLNKIPRPSGHEKAVSDYLAHRLQELGLSVVQDEKNNLIADLPASKGYEHAPRVALQGHMDMVCVAQDGKVYDPLTDAIETERDEQYLRAKGTSLGADDGIGVAVILYVLQHAKKHGALRVILTTDEEVGMSGAISLASEHLQGVDFLINCDSENYDELTVGSAGSVHLDFHKSFQRVQLPYHHAWKLEVAGLKGGHSGERIGDGRANAIQEVAMCFAALDEAKISYALVSFQGGKARNAIPNQAEAVFLTDAAESDLQKVFVAEQKRFLGAFSTADADGKITLTAVDSTPVTVMPQTEATAFLRLLRILHTGVYAMSQITPGLVETSANLGMASVQDDQAMIAFFPRSGIDEKLIDFRRRAEDLAQTFGFTLDEGAFSPAWKERKDSRLKDVMNEVFKAQNHGQGMKVMTIHAGLECGWHCQKNPALDMVSIGVTTLDIHSPKEHVELKTIAPEVRLLLAVLEKLAE